MAELKLKNVWAEKLKNVWAFWAATSFGLAFKNVGLQEDNKKEALNKKRCAETDKKKKRR